jgi:PGF-pre-PGF domain-containing protein
MDIGSSSVGVAVSTDGKKVYVTDGGNKVFVIDTTTSKVIATVNGLNSSHGIAITPDGAKAYVANWGNGSVSDNGTVSVIDTATKTVTNTVTVGSIPHGVAVSPNGKKVYVTNYDGTISVIDTATDNVVDTIDIGQYPWGIVVNPEGTKVYVANYGSINYSPSHNVSVIDTATNTITDRVKVGNGSYGVAVNPEGTKVYVTNYLENTTSVIDTTTSTVIAIVPVGGGPYGVSVTPDGKKVYVANQGSNYDPSGNTVSVIDATTNTVTATVKVGDGPTAFGQFIAPLVPEQTLPVANFNSNVTEGYAPLTVQFSDLSQKASSRTWDFNSDGQPDSSDISPVYVYANAGTYTVNLTVSNENGTSSKTAVINVLTQNSSSGGSSEGSSHSSSSGGGAGVSSEPAKNVQGKELSQAFISNGKSVKFDFPKNATCVVYVSFYSKKTAGKTTTIAEQLKNKSILVSELNAGEVYKYFNLWVGTGGFASSKNIENSVVCFKVEKAWLQDKNIDQASITLNRYGDKKWSQLPVKLLCEDNKYLYFTAKTPEFSFFAIAGKQVERESGTAVKPVTETHNIEQNNTSLGVQQQQKTENKSEKEKIASIPGFGTVCVIACLLTVFLYKKR